MVAEALLRQRLQEVGNGVPVREAKTLKYETIRESLLSDYRINEISSLITTADGTEKVWGLNHLDDFFSGELVKNITTPVLRRFIEQRQAHGAANATINRNLALLRRMMNIARQDGKMSSLPHFPMLKEDNVRQGFVDPPTFAKLLATLPELLRPLVLFLYYTGCRIGAARQIEWSQVHFENDASEIWLPDHQTKNNRPLILPLPAELTTMLKKLFRVSGPVFATTNLRKAWEKACVKVGLGQFDEKGSYSGLLIHDLRRSGVRNLTRAGVQTKVAMKISGHLTESVFQRYNIVDTADIHVAMAKVEANNGSLMKVGSKGSLKRR